MAVLFSRWSTIARCGRCIHVICSTSLGMTDDISEVYSTDNRAQQLRYGIIICNIESDAAMLSGLNLGVCRVCHNHTTSCPIPVGQTFPFPSVVLAWANVYRPGAHNGTYESLTRRFQRLNSRIKIPSSFHFWVWPFCAAGQRRSSFRRLIWC